MVLAGGGALRAAPNFADAAAQGPDEPLRYKAGQTPAGAACKVNKTQIDRNPILLLNVK
jgi:hypothetical protein